MKHVFSREDIDNTKIFLHGRSLGGAVVNYVMTHTNYPVAGVILENTFTSIADLIDIMFPKISFMKGAIQRNYWPSITRVGKISQPILFVMGNFFLIKILIKIVKSIFFFKKKPKRMRLCLLIKWKDYI